MGYALMLDRIGSRLKVETAAMTAVFRNRELRRVEAAWGAIALAEWTFAISLGIYAFEHGGPEAIATVIIARVLPGAFFAPLSGFLSDRFAPRTVLVIGGLSVSTVLASVSVVSVTHGPFLTLVALTCLFAIAKTPFLPAEGALVPRLARTPSELAAANVVHSALESLAFLTASLGVGAVLTFSTFGLSFTIACAFALCSTALALRVRPRDRPEHLEQEETGSLFKEALIGLRTIAGETGLRIPSMILVSLAVLQGASEVLVVVVTLDLLGLPESSAAYLNANWAAAAIVGGLLLTVLLNRRRLVSGLGTGAALLGLGLLLPAASPGMIPVLVGFAMFGIGYALVEAASHTLLHRLADEEAVGRIRGTFEAARLAAMAAGAFLVPVGVEAIGTRWTLVVAALVLPIYSLARLPRLREFEVGAPLDERQFELLRNNEIFAPLQIATLEMLCHELEPVTFSNGSAVITEGEPGDLFYMVDEGTVEVLEGGTKRRDQGPGSSFGEIALLRDTPRTATVRATSDLRLLALEREAFLSAVSGHARVHSAAHRVADERLLRSASPPSNSHRVSSRD